MQSLDPPGRFIKQNLKTQDWEEIGEDMAIVKICQALREGRRSKNRKEQSKNSLITWNHNQTVMRFNSLFDDEEKKFIIETFLPMTRSCWRT